ncbi:biopolymer transporter ExbD [Burkholderia sp. Bp9012]|uniref:ExbD/TolR family protein n=1 Tax=Burkholderia sp. Bp9012 TaxID=2184562 RepID=UPI0016280E06|nr:biopolymer transporter ExbD [Burkholderia sp. Bp9012]
MRARANRRRAGCSGAMSLNLVSLIDILTTLVFFLLMTAAGVATNVTADRVSLPVSASSQAPRIALQVTVSTGDIRVGPEIVESVDAALADRGAVLGRLQAAVSTAHATTSPPSSGGDIDVIADKRVPFALLRKVIASCVSGTGFDHVSLALLHEH